MLHATFFGHSFDPHQVQKFKNKQEKWSAACFGQMNEVGNNKLKV